MRKKWKKNLGENPLNWGVELELGNGFNPTSHTLSNAS